jgi:hypothetical protein
MPAVPILADLRCLLPLHTLDKMFQSSFKGYFLRNRDGSRTIRRPANSLTIVLSLRGSNFFNSELSTSPPAQLDK